MFKLRGKDMPSRLMITPPGAILGYRKDGRPIRVIAGGALDVDTLPGDTAQFQMYLDELKNEQISTLENRLVERFGTLRASENLDDEGLAQLTRLKDQIEFTRTERQKRKSAAAKARAEQTASAHREAVEALAADVYGTDGPEDDTDGDDEDKDEVESLASTMAKAFSMALEGVQTSVTASGVNGADLNKHVRHMPLSQVQKHAPDPKLQTAREEPVIVASADIPGVAKNGRVSGIKQLVQLMGDRANMLPPTRGNPNYVNVAKLKRDFRYRLNLDSTPNEVNEVLQAATDVGALTAAGGWCAPSEISYDFFNIVCEDGMIDLPTVGVLNRGGFRFPTSPAISSIFGSDGLWTWTEADDVSAETPPGPTKTCVRVPCPDFNEVRSLCDGLCVTAGNLTDFAYSELIENYLRLVMAARSHVTNQSIIAQLASASTPVNMSGSGEGTTASILNSMELQAFDYRERYRMCEDAILESVIPRWAIGAIRADLANRNGINLLSVTAAMIADWLNERNIRAQFVTDWQSGFSGSPIGDPGVIPTAWPATVDFMIYAPGNFVRGQALQLDLGVVRDSALNETNDHTAAWMEDCYAVAEVGHESRLVTTDVCTAGVTGAADLVCPS